jgi:hypothetical protein
VNSANDLVEAWKKLVNNGFPLDKVSSVLNIADEPIEIIKTIDALECCSSTNGMPYSILHKQIHRKFFVMSRSHFPQLSNTMTLYFEAKFFSKKGCQTSVVTW